MGFPTSRPGSAAPSPNRHLARCDTIDDTALDIRVIGVALVNGGPLEIEGGPVISDGAFDLNTGVPANLTEARSLAVSTRAQTLQLLRNSTFNAFAHWLL
jgi:hypothetical protein